MFDDIPRPTCRVYTVSDKHLRHGGSGYETRFCVHAQVSVLHILHAHPPLSFLMLVQYNIPLGGRGSSKAPAIPRPLGNSL